MQKHFTYKTSLERYEFVIRIKIEAQRLKTDAVMNKISKIQNLGKIGDKHTFQFYWNLYLNNLQKHCTNKASLETYEDTIRTLNKVQRLKTDENTENTKSLKATSDKHKFHFYWNLYLDNQHGRKTLGSDIYCNYGVFNLCWIIQWAMCVCPCAPDIHACSQHEDVSNKSQ